MPHRPSYQEDDMIIVRFPKLLALLLFFVAACRVSEGQAVYGNIIGTVTDPSGGVVPNAAVVSPIRIVGLPTKRSQMQAATTNRLTFWPVTIRLKSLRRVSVRSKPPQTSRLTPRLAWTRNWDLNKRLPK